MKQSVFKVILILFILISRSVSFSQAFRISDSDSAQYPMKQNGIFQLYNREGYVFIESWKKDSIKIRTVKRIRAESQESAMERLAGLKVIHKQSCKKLLIQIRDHSDNSQFHLFDFFDRVFWEETGWSHGEVDVYLRVPENIRLKIRQKQGNITLSGITGNLSLSVNHGRIEISECQLERSQIQLKDGQIYLSQIQSADSWFCVCDRGRLNVQDAQFKDAEFFSGSARLRLENIISESCLIQSDKGDVYFECAAANKGITSVRSKHGDVSLQLNDQQNAAIQIKTVKGTFISNLSQNPDQIRKGDDKYYSVTLGEGENKIFIQTFSGDIDIY